MGLVKLANSKGKSGESANRIFGNKKMGLLFSKVQAAVIQSGFELEKLIYAAIPTEMVTTLEALNDSARNIQNLPPIQVVFKPSKPNPDNPNKSIEADLLVVDNLNRLIWLVEVKEGYVFDTKKADGELSSLKNITSWLAQEFPYKTQYFLCSFNQEDRETIVQGTKKRFSLDHVLTGRELCTKIGIDYDALRNKRKEDQTQNRRYFLKTLIAIPEIRAEIIELLGTTDAPDDQS